MATCSSYEKLTQLSTSTPARATDLIVFLIQSLAREVCDSIRGAQTQYCIVSRARDICNRINELVEAAERNKDWADYGSWTAQIGPLEERLLDLSKLVESEGEAAYSSLSPKSISECLSHIKCWKENRKISRDVAQMLHTPPFELPSYAWDSELKAAAQEDDLSWVSVVCEALTEALSPLAPGFQEKPKQYAHIIEVVRLLAEIQTGLGLNAEIVEDSKMVLSTRCFMVIHGMLTVARDESVEPKIRKHLWSRRTWKMAFGLLEKLNSVIQDPEGSPDELVKEWDEYEEYLSNPKDESVESVTEPLIPYPAKIQRPYHAQALALVKLSLDIGAHVKSNKPDDGIDRLENIVESTIKALDMCASTATQVAKFDWNEARANPASKMIDDVVNEIKEVYKHYRMNVEDVENAMSIALKKDREVVELLGGHLLRLRARNKPIIADPHCDQVPDTQPGISDKNESTSSLDRSPRQPKVNLRKDHQPPPTGSTDATLSSGNLDSVLPKRVGSPNQPFMQTFSSFTNRLRFYVYDITNSMNSFQHDNLKDGHPANALNPENKHCTSPTFLLSTKLSAPTKRFGVG